MIKKLKIVRFVFIMLTTHSHMLSGQTYTNTRTHTHILPWLEYTRDAVEQIFFFRVREASLNGCS